VEPRLRNGSSWLTARSSRRASRKALRMAHKFGGDFEPMWSFGATKKATRYLIRCFLSGQLGHASPYLSRRVCDDKSEVTPHSHHRDHWDDADEDAGTSTSYDRHDGTYWSDRPG
jgi:hypothetical protein